MRSKGKLVLAFLVIIVNAEYLNAQLTVSKVKGTRGILLENFTGINLIYGADASKYADNILNYYPSDVISYMEVHAGYYSLPNTGQIDLRTVPGNALDAVAKPSGYPMGMVNRQKFAGQSSRVIGRGYWFGYSDSVSRDSTPVNINLEAVYDDLTKKISVEVALYYTETVTASHYINVAITQDSIIGDQVNGSVYFPSRVLPNGKFVHMHILREYITPQWGYAVSNTNKGSQINETFIHTTQAVNGIPFDISNAHIVAYVTNGLGFSQVVTARTDWSIDTGVVASSISGLTKMNGNTSISDTRRVYLIRRDPSTNPPKFTVVDSMETGDAFVFSNPDPGTYLIRAALLPGQSNYPVYAPAYHEKGFLWDHCDSVVHQHASAGLVVDIIRGNKILGPGSISGIVCRKLPPSGNIPVPGMNMILTTDSDEVVEYYRTDVMGKYSFANLKYGTYRLYCDLLNIHCNPMIITLSPQEPNSIDGKMVVNSTTVGPLGSVEQEERNSSPWSIYPNPVKRTLTLRGISIAQEDFELKIFDRSGKVVLNETGQSDAGWNLIEINTSDLNPGLFFLHFHSASISRRMKFVVE